MDRSGTRRDGLLTYEDVEVLTGRKFKSQQIEALLLMGIPFALNACGEPVVPRSAIDGSAAQARREVMQIKDEQATMARERELRRRSVTAG